MESKVFKKLLWTLPSISNSFETHEIGKSIQSPTLEINLNEVFTKWVLDFYPRGKGRKAWPDPYCSIFVRNRQSSSTNFYVKFKHGVVAVNENQEDFVSGICVKSGDEFKRSGWGQSIPHEKILGVENSYIQSDGSVTLFCEFTVYTENPELRVCQDVDGSSEVSSYIERMFEQEIFSDFELRTNDEKVLKAHKCILSSRSSVFQAMLNSNMKEAQEGFVDVPDFDSNTMKEVLRFIYLGEVKNLDHLAQHLIFAADKYQLESLKQKCIGRMMTKLTTKNVMKILVIAEKINAKKLVEECLDVILSNYRVLSKTLEFEELPKEIRWMIHDKLNEKYQFMTTVHVSGY